MRRFPAILSIFVLLALFLTGCAQEEPPAETPQRFRLASNLSENYVTNQACRYFCALVEERSGGRIIIEPFFDGALGTEDSVLEQCAYGGVDFARVSSVTAAKYAPLLTALQMPYEYTSDEHLFRVLDGEIGQKVFDTFPEELTGMTYLYAGYRCFFSTREALDSLEKVRGKRLRVAAAQVNELVTRWNAVSVPLDEDELTLALRTGAVDGAEDNLPSYVFGGYYRLAPYWVYDRHSYMTDMLVASSQSLRRLSESDRELIFTCAREAAAWQRERWIAAEVRAMMHASHNGCYMTLIDDDEVARFREAAMPVYDSLTAEQQAIVDEVLALADPE